MRKCAPEHYIIRRYRCRGIDIILIIIIIIGTRTFLTKLGELTAPKPLKISGTATTGPLDNRWEQVIGYVKTFADVIIT